MREIHFGDRGPDVASWQRFLARRGYDLRADGIYGVKTESATRAVQRAAGLPTTGTVTAATWALAERLDDLPPSSSAFDEQAARYGHVERALGVVGHGAADLPPYLDLIAPNEIDRANAQICRDLASMSGCALTVRGLWVRAGVRASCLLEPYRVGRAVADVVSVAEAAGALRAPSVPPKPGDVVVIGGPEHVLTVTSIQPAAGVTIVHSVDGGQRDSQGKQTIKARDRVMTPGILGGRTILHVIDCVELSRSWAKAAHV